jgi:hypothetical protein
VERNDKLELKASRDLVATLPWPGSVSHQQYPSCQTSCVINSVANLVDLPVASLSKKMPFQFILSSFAAHIERSEIPHQPSTRSKNVNNTPSICLASHLKTYGLFAVE